MKKLVLIFLLLVPCLLVAQVEKGDMELGLFGNYNAPTEGGGGSGVLGVTATGYFSPHFSAGTSITLAMYSGIKDYLDPSAGNELKITPFLGIFATYNFLTSNAKLLPYIGAQFDMTWVETVDYIPTGDPQNPVIVLELYEGIYYVGGKAGMKFFVTEMINLDVNFKYQTLVSGPEGYTAGNIGVNFGIGVILPRKK